MDAGWISNNQRFGFIKALRAERIVLRQTTKLTEQIVGINVVCPSVSQRFPDFRLIVRSEKLFYTTKLSDKINIVRL